MIGIAFTTRLIDRDAKGTDRVADPRMPGFRVSSQVPQDDLEVYPVQASPSSTLRNFASQALTFSGEP